MRTIYVLKQGVDGRGAPPAGVRVATTVEEFEAALRGARNSDIAVIAGKDGGVWMFWAGYYPPRISWPQHDYLTAGAKYVRGGRLCSPKAAGDMARILASPEGAEQLVQALT